MIHLIKHLSRKKKIKKLGSVTKVFETLSVFIYSYISIFILLTVNFKNTYYIFNNLEV